MVAAISLSQPAGRVSATHCITVADRGCRMRVAGDLRMRDKPVPAWDVRIGDTGCPAWDVRIGDKWSPAWNVRIGDMGSHS